MTTVGNYSTLGSGFESKKVAETNAIECCLPGAFMNCKTGWRPKGTCKDLMAKKCSVMWDKTCDIFLGGLTEYTSNGWEARQFLDKTAELKYFNPPNSENERFTDTCHQITELVDPNDPDSPVITAERGSFPIYHNGDLLTTSCPILSPTYRGICSNTGTLKSTGSSVTPLSPADTLFQRCREFGACKNSIRKIILTRDQTKKLQEAYKPGNGFSTSGQSRAISAYRN